MKPERSTAPAATALAAGLLAILAACWACGDGEAGGDGGELHGAVLILVDTMRPDHLSCYGYERPTSPRLDHLAGEGVLFENVISFSPWTLPSVVNILSGSKPNARVFEKNRLKRSLVEDIGGAGYVTAAFTEGGFVSKFFHLDRGFDHYREEEGAVQLHIPGKPRNENAPGSIDRTFKLAREWLETHGGERFFLLIHTYEPHSPYTRQTFTEGMTPPHWGETFTMETIVRMSAGDLAIDESGLEYLTALYDGGILETDRHIGEFLDFLDRKGLSDKVLVAVTSDHGEELGEHYISRSGRHGHSCLDNLVKVPLIIRNPCEGYPVKRIDRQVRLVDVMPTIADILGAPVEGDVDGASLVPLMRGEDSSPRPAAGGATKGGPERMFLRWLDYKYIRVIGPEPQDNPLDPPPPPMQLYDLRADPGERDNLARKEPDIVRSMMRILAGTEDVDSGDFSMPGEMDARLRERLESLGY
jgi:arylsulfatase A-like enzyme